jgi:hypothetical protein
MLKDDDVLLLVSISISIGRHSLVIGKQSSQVSTLRDLAAWKIPVARMFMIHQEHWRNMKDSCFAWRDRRVSFEATIVYWSVEPELP